MQTQFKQYQRGVRTQLIEESFSAGMQYSTAPLSEGYIKELVNYDIKDSGNALVPRPGIQATNLYKTAVGVDTQLFAAKHTVENNKQFDQFITGTIDNATIPDTNLYTGSLEVHTCAEDGSVAKVELGSSSKAIYTKPIKAEIHKLDLSETTPIARNVGTVGFNNSYYCFIKTGDTYKLNQTKFNGSNAYQLESLEPKKLTPKEAVMWGYNMLDSNPYSFACSNVGAGVNLLGLMPYDDKDELTLSPIMNQSLTLKCFYAAASATYKVVWDFKDVSATSWTVLETQTVSTADNQPFTLKTSFPTEQIMVRITVYAGTETELEKAVPLQVLVVGFNLSKEGYGSTANISPQKYTLSTATGMTYWKNRIVLYGVKEDPTQLFMSELNDPTYFPYPNNVDLFELPIMYVTPYLDNLLVFTTRQLWMLTMSEDGLSWNKKLIQSNLTINSWDLHLIKIVKNMVFFRSGNYFYMVVPKATSTTGELVIAPISKQIEPLLNNFETSVENTLEKLYNYKEPLELIHYYNYLDYEDIHNVYVFKTTKGVYLNYVLLYNSLVRYWRIYTFESENFVIPYKQDATRKGTLMSKHAKGIELYMYNQNDPRDLSYNLEGTELVGAKHFLSYQMLDTGYREHSSDFKKRYRELQLKINNTSQQQLKFYSEFVIDGSLRKDSMRYQAVHHVDKNDPKYGYITLERLLTEPSVIPSTTVLGKDKDDTDCWMLDSSLFPEVVLWKIRIPVSGKGYAPGLTLISLNQYPYELLNMSWIFRLLNSR